MPPLKGTRLTLFLPVPNVWEQSAAAEIINRLVGTYGGSTSSLVLNPVFEGYWISRGGEPLKELVSFVVVDIENRDLDEPAFVEELEQIRTRAFETYERTHTNAAQDEIWLVAHPISMFSSNPNA